MRCPKCGSHHIRDGLCVMCGAIVIHDVQIPERTCLACGRKERFIGSVCKDCGDAISRGAKALQKAAQLNMRQDKEPVFAECPAAIFLEALWQKIKEQEDRRRKRQQERRLERIAAGEIPRSKPLTPEQRERKRAHNREYMKEYAKTEAGKAAIRRGHEATKASGYWKKRWEMIKADPELMKKHQEECRVLAAKRRAERAAMTPEEKQAFWTSEKGQRIRAQKAASARRRRKDPEQAAKMREYRLKYSHSEKGKATAARYRERKKALLALIRENEKLDRERLREGIARYERQWEASGAEDRGNQGAVRGDRLGGDHTGESELGVVVNGRVCAAEGSSMVENGTV